MDSFSIISSLIISSTTVDLKHKILIIIVIGILPLILDYLKRYLYILFKYNCESIQLRYNIIYWNDNNNKEYLAVSKYISNHCTKIPIIVNSKLERKATVEVLDNCMETKIQSDIYFYSVVNTYERNQEESMSVFRIVLKTYKKDKKYQFRNHH